MSNYGLKTLMLGVAKASIKKQEDEIRLLLGNQDDNCWKTLVKATTKLVYAKLLIDEYVKIESEPEQKLLT